MQLTFSQRLIRGLHVQMLLLVLVPIAIVLMVVAVSWAVLHEKAMHELVGRRDARVAQVVADNVNERLQRRQMALGWMAQHVDEHDGLTILERETHLFDYGLLRVHPDGWEMEDWLPQGWWDWRLGSPGETLYAPYEGEDGLVIFSAPVPDGGYLYGANSLSSLGIDRILKDIVGESDANVYLIDTHMTVIYASQEEWIGETFKHPGGREALAGEVGFQPSRNKHHKDWVVVYSPIETVGWGLVVEEPWYSVTTPRLRITNAILLVLLLIVLLGLVVIGFSALWVVRPLQRLKDRARRLMNGDFEAIQQPVGGIQEIGDLQQALAQMAQSVQEAQSRLHDYIGIITTAQEDERTRLARDLHDDTVQTLIALNQQAQKAQRLLEKEPAAAAQRLSELRRTAEQAIQDIRAMIHDLRPTYLSELGLAPALEMLAEQEDNIPVKVEIEGEIRRLSSDEELALYRIAQEALSNIRKHSQATQATLHLRFTPQEVSLAVSDNGQGFVPPSMQRLPRGHYGLIGMQERAQLIHARLGLESQPGRGTQVRVQLAFTALLR